MTNGKTMEEMIQELKAQRKIAPAPLPIKGAHATNMTPIKVQLPSKIVPDGERISPAEYRRRSKKIRKSEKGVRNPT